MKLRRDLAGSDLAKALRVLGYQITGQVGSHMRLTPQLEGEHHVTVPDHSTLRVGTAHGSRFAYTDLPGEEVAVGAGCGAFVPWLGGEGHPRPGNVDYALGAGVTANAPVLFAMDFAPAAIPLGGGCTQNLATPVGIGWRLASQNGVARLPVPLPLQPALRGLTAFAQIATLQPGGPLGGVALSAGLRIRVGD